MTRRCGGRHFRAGWVRAAVGEPTLCRIELAKLDDVIRRLFFILICLGLALQAPAARALEKTPCPMEATMQAMLAAGDLDPADLPDCCNDLQTFAATGHLCKSGSDCGTSPTAFWIPAQPSTAPTAALSAISLARPAPPFAAPIAQPWRPPAAR